jgi:ElaB/YqjD/DUF883 family membrane-anchored ribosome-binding protein
VQALLRAMPVRTIRTTILLSCEKGTTMDTTNANFGKNTRAFADSTAEKVHSGIRSAQGLVSNATDAVAGTAKDIQAEAAPLIQNAARRAKSTAQQTMDAASDIAQETRDVAADASDSIVSFTKQNPVKALAIAAASGALLYAAIKTLQSYRD